MIELRLNSKDSLDLEPKTQIALSFELLDLVKMNVINGSFSNKIRVLKTSKNRIIFENIGDVGVASDLPYKKIPAILIINGSAIGNTSSSYIIISKVTNLFYELTYYNIVNTLLEQIEDTTFENSGILPTIERTLDTIKTYNEGGGDKDIAFLVKTNISSERLYRLPPILSQTYLIKKILQKYNLKITNIKDYTIALNYYTPSEFPEFDERLNVEVEKDKELTINKRTSYTSLTKSAEDITGTNSTNFSETIYTFNNVVYGETYLLKIKKLACIFNLSTVIPNQRSLFYTFNGNRFFVTIKVALYVNGVEETNFNRVSNTEFDYYFLVKQPNATIEIKYSAIINQERHANDERLFSFLEFDFDLTKNTVQSSFDLNKLFGSLNFKKVIQDYAKMHGIIFTITRDKEYKAVYINEILSGDNGVINWSNKDVQIISEKYQTSGVTKTNNYKYKNDNLKHLTFDNGTELNSKETDNYTFDFNSFSASDYNVYEISTDPILKYNLSNCLLQKSLTKPNIKIIGLRAPATVLNITEVDTSVSSPTLEILPTDKNNQSTLTPENITGKLESIFKNYIEIDVSIHLKITDIQEIDLSKLVYIEELGGNFIIKKIHGYQKDKRTKVTLIKTKARPSVPATTKTTLQ